MFDRAPKARAEQPSNTSNDAHIHTESAAVDQQSVKTLNSAIEAVLKGECSGVCIIATGANGLQRFWVSFAKNTAPQREAIRYLGLTRLFEEVLGQIVCDGIDIETSGV